jgi:hypothetical protein
MCDTSFAFKYRYILYIMSDNRVTDFKGLTVTVRHQKQHGAR